MLIGESITTDGGAISLTARREEGRGSDGIIIGGATGATLSSGAGSVTMNSIVGISLLDDANETGKISTSAGDVTMHADGDIDQFGSITTGTGNVTLEGANVNSTNLITSAGGDVTLVADTNLAIGGALASVGGNVKLQAAGTATITESVSSSGGNIDISAGLITIDDAPIDAGAGDARFTANDMDFGGTTTIAGQRNLVIQPPTVGTIVRLGTFSPTLGGLQLDEAELATLLPDFTHITFGRSDGADVEIDIDPTSAFIFQDPITVLTAGDINLLAAIEGTDDASIELAGSGLTILAGDIITAGQRITITDDVQLDTGVTLNTTARGFVDGAEVTLSGSVASQGNDLTFIAGRGAVTADGANNDFATIAANAGSLSLIDINDLNLGASTLTGNLSLTAGGNITAGALTIAGDSAFNAGGSITLVDPANDFGGAVALAAPVDATVLDADDIDLGASTVGGALSVTAAGNITDSGALDITGLTTLVSTGGSILLDAGNDFGGAVSADGADVTLNDVNDLDLDATTATGQLTVTATGNITDSGVSNSLTVTGATSLAAGGSVVLDGANDFGGAVSVTAADATINDIDDLDLGPSTVTGALAVTAAGDITGSGALDIGGAASFASTAGSILLGAANDFVGAVSANGVDVSINDVNDLDLGSTTATAQLTLSAGGAITDSGVLLVTGPTSLTATGAITLDAANDFGGSVTANAGALTLNDVNDVDLGASAVTGALTVTAAGQITDSGALDIGGPATFASTGGSILLDAANDFGGAVSASGADVTINDVNALALGASTVTGQLTVTAADAITQTASLLVTGAGDFNAGGALVLDNRGNDFDGAVTFTSTGASIADSNTLTLGASAAGTGDLTVTAVDLNLAGLVSGSGALRLQPFFADQTMGIGVNSGQFSLSAAELADLANGFSSITFGFLNYAGDITVENVTFNDPLTLQVNGTGGSVLINGTLRGADDATISIQGSGATTTLNGGIVTSGRDIFINDNVILAGDSTLDTTNGGQVLPGGDITITGSVAGAASVLTVSGGFWTAPNIDLGGLNMDESGLGADVSGSVNGFGDRAAAQNVNVLGDGFDPDFLINGCVMGIACEGQEPHIDPPTLGDLSRQIAVNLPVVWDSPRALVDPRDIQYSNLGNEELWWRRTKEEETP